MFSSDFLSSTLLYISKVSVIDMTVTLLYDMNDCDYAWSDWTANSNFYWINTRWNSGGWWVGQLYQWTCSNPLTLIMNHGQMEMENVIINMIVTESDKSIDATPDYRCFNFEDDGDYGFISNYGYITIHNLTMERSLSRYMLYNEGMSSRFMHCSCYFK